MKNLIYIVGVCILATACSSGNVPSSSGEGYKEDLSAYRPEFKISEDSITEVETNASKNEADYATITPVYDVTEQLNTVLDSIVKLRADINYVDGYTILVYSGTNSETAHIAKGKVFGILPDSSPILKFDEPNFRVKVGKYYSRLEAQRDYALIKENFSKAIIIPERIYID